MDAINFYLPGFYREKRNMLLLDILTTDPDIFEDGIQIGALYGCFPGAIWNGGRVCLGSCTKQDMEETIAYYNARKVPLRFTFTNPLIEEKHLNDTYCNLCLELADGGFNEVLVNSPILEDYIRKNYPKYRILSSTTKGIVSPEDLTAELAKDYGMVVPDTTFNHSEALFALPKKEKIELLINSYCRDDCPNRKEHYDAVGKCQLTFSHADFGHCNFIRRDFYHTAHSNHSFVSREDLYEKYIPAGFRHFKLDGRGFNKYKVLESYMYYLPKVEYRDMLRLTILRELDR